MKALHLLIVACVLLSSTEALAKKKSAKAKAKAKAAAAAKKEDHTPKAVDKQPKKVEKAAPAAPVQEARTDTSKETIKRESKIEFDDRVVQGQRAAGAVYLFQRAETQFGSLVQTPDSFRQRTVGQVFGE